MTDEKPTTAAEYHAEDTDLVVRTCLTLATHLGDLIDDIVVIGGLVPTLVVDQNPLAAEDEHVGTVDLDLGLTVALLSHKRYQQLTDRLRRAGFVRDKNPQGHYTNQRWKLPGESFSTIDFLIPPTRDDDRGGTIKNIESDFAALIAPGLELAFRDRIQVELRDITLHGEQATRYVWVCGPGAYTVLKALAFDARGENKDAYDLYYMLRYHESGIEDVAARWKPFLQHPSSQKAVGILRRDFLTHDGPGAIRVARFLTGELNDDIQADVTLLIQQLLQLAGVLTSKHTVEPS